MNALVYKNWQELELQQIDSPKPAAGELLLRVAACGICGSELEAFKHQSPRRTPPLVMGHEFCGTVAGFGADVHGFNVGDRVVSHSVVSCGTCLSCERNEPHLCPQRQVFGMHRAGAFAEEVTVPARAVVPWPEGLPAEVACLAEPLANGLHVAGLIAGANPEHVAVLGAGPIGLMCAMALQVKFDIKVRIAELLPPRMRAARDAGIAIVLDAGSPDFERILARDGAGDGMDVIVDAVGSALTKRISLAGLRPGGTAVWLGLHENAFELPTYDITLPEKHVIGSYAATLEEMAEAVSLLATPEIDSRRWVKQFPLMKGREAFLRMLAADGDDIKAVIRMEQTR